MGSVETLSLVATSVIDRAVSEHLFCPTRLFRITLKFDGIHVDTVQSLGCRQRLPDRSRSTGMGLDVMGAKVSRSRVAGVCVVVAKFRTRIESLGSYGIGRNHGAGVESRAWGDGAALRHFRPMTNPRLACHRRCCNFLYQYSFHPENRLPHQPWRRKIAP